MNPLKTDLSSDTLCDALLEWTTRKISTSRWSVNGPIDTKARIKRWWLFHLRAEISFAHLGTCRRRYRRLPSARREDADWAHFNEYAKAKALYSRTRRINGHGKRHRHLLLRYRDYAVVIDEPDFLAPKFRTCRMCIIVANCPLLETAEIWSKKLIKEEKKKW